MIAVPVADTSQVGDARRRVRALTEQHGWPELAAARAALLVTELATNIVTHAGSGQILAALDDAGLGVLALDRGAGMAHPDACRVDGYSTAGTLGHGLGAIERQSDALSIASWPGRGTAVLARIDSPTAPAGPGRQPPVLGAVVIAAPGEEACGDAWSAQTSAGVTTLLVIDGLGHGVDAARAAHAGVVEFQRVPDRSPTRCVDDIHAALRATRGGALAVARVDPASATITFVGIGNIAGTHVGRDGRVRRMVSHNGIAGHNARRIQAFEYPCGPGWLVMHSDGIDTRWSLDRYPGMAPFDPMLIAGLLYRDHLRGRDDASVVVLAT